MEQLRKQNEFVFLKFMIVILHVQQPTHTCSSPESRSELRPQLVRAPRPASNFHVQYDGSECKIYRNAEKIVIYNFWSITRNITRSVIIAISH